MPGGFLQGGDERIPKKFGSKSQKRKRLKRQRTRRRQRRR